MARRQRKHGDGQVRFREDRNVYQITYQVETPTGKKQIRATFKTESEAYTALENRTVDARRGQHGDLTITLGQWMKDPRLQLREEARRIVEREFSGLYSRRLAQITTGDLLRAQARLLARNLSNDSVNDYLRALITTLHRAEEDRLIPSVPTIRREKWLKQTINRQELTDPERAALLKVFDDPAKFAKLVNGPSRHDADLAWKRFLRFRRVYILALETGLARKDLLGLRWKQIDLKAGLLTGRRYKSGEAYKVPLTEAALDVLREIRSDKVQHELVLTTVAGDQYTPKYVHVAFDRMKTLAKITRRLRWHDLRFSYGQRLADANLSDAIIARSMGHAPDSRMPRRYAQPTDDVQIERVREALEG